MTKESLTAYRSKKEELKELKSKLASVESDTGTMLLDYHSGQSIDPIGQTQEQDTRLEQRYKDRIRKLEEECHQVEEFIETIPDSLMRRIFRMKFIEGYTQQSISIKVHLDRSRVSRKIDAFLKEKE